MRDGPSRNSFLDRSSRFFLYTVFRVLDTRTSRLIWTALLLSAIFHIFLLIWFKGIYVGRLVIPAERKKTFRPFEIRQVEIPQKLLQPDTDDPNDKVASVSQIEVPKQLPEPGKANDSTMLANPPQPTIPDLPTGSASALSPKIVAAPENVSPFAPSDQAKITAEVSKFAVEPNLNSIPVPDANLPGGSMSSTTPGAPPPETSGQSSAGDGTTLPSLEQVQTQFRMASPTVDPVPQPVIVRLPADILFDFDSAQLRSGADASLQLAVDYIKQYGRANIEVSGHTDTFGADDYNLKLSQARAQSVMDWLESHMGPSDNYQWTAKGYGKSRPIVNPKGTIAQQEKNRRVEIMIRAVR